MQRNLTSTSTIAGAPKQGRKLSPVLIGGAALVLAAAAGIATWQGIAQRESSAPVTESSVVEVAPATVQQAGVPALDTAVTVYIVDSQAEADRLLATIADGDRLLEQFGKPAFNAQVVVAASAEEEAAIEWAHAEANAYRASMGLAPIELMNLRGR